MTALTLVAAPLMAALPLFLGSIGMPELLVLLAILMLMFGASKLPQIGRGLGEGISNFKKGLKSDDKADQIEEGASTEDGSARG